MIELIEFSNWGQYTADQEHYFQKDFTKYTHRFKHDTPDGTAINILLEFLSNILICAGVPPDISEVKWSSLIVFLGIGELVQHGLHLGMLISQSEFPEFELVGFPHDIEVTGDPESPSPLDPDGTVS
jgi:hypothetical protein